MKLARAHMNISVACETGESSQISVACETGESSQISVACETGESSQIKNEYEFNFEF
jgi:hypothetical protein